MRKTRFFLSFKNSRFVIIRFVFQLTLTHDPHQISTRLSIGILWIFTINVTVAYRSMLTSLLSVPIFYRLINNRSKLEVSDLTSNMVNYGGSLRSNVRNEQRSYYNLGKNEVH